MRDAQPEVLELSNEICDVIDKYEDDLDLAQIVGILNNLVHAYIDTSRQNAKI